MVVTPQSTGTARITWSATYCHDDTEPDTFTVILAPDDGTQSRSLTLTEAQWKGMEYDVDVDPGTQYSISLMAENVDGVTSSEPVHFESEPDSKSCVYICMNTQF